MMIDEDLVLETLRTVVEWHSNKHAHRLPRWIEQEPGALLWRLYQAWLSKSNRAEGKHHTFSALQHLLGNDVPALNSRLYGRVKVKEDDARKIVTALLKTWDENGSAGSENQWVMHLTLDGQSKSSPYPIEDIESAVIEATFSGHSDRVLIRDSVGVVPSEFEKAQRNSTCVVVPVLSEFVRQFDEVNALHQIKEFILGILGSPETTSGNRGNRPILVWVIKVNSPYDNEAYYQSLNSLFIYRDALQSWQSLEFEKGNYAQWIDMIKNHCCFAVHGLPKVFGISQRTQQQSIQSGSLNVPMPQIDQLLLSSFLPSAFQDAISPRVRRLRKPFVNAQILTTIHHNENSNDSSELELRYWIAPLEGVSKNKDRDNFRVIRASRSPGTDYDIANNAIYNAASYVLKLQGNAQYLSDIEKRGWTLFSAAELLLDTNNLVSTEVENEIQVN